MPPPLDEDKRQSILEAIRAVAGTGTRSRADIAREFSVSGSTVGRIATDAGLVNPWDRTKTQKGTQARQVDLAELRSITSARFLQKCNEMLDRIDEPCEVYAFGGIANEFTSQILDGPPSMDARNFMISAATALDKHLVLDRHDSDDKGGAAVDAWLRHVIGGATQM